ncbi:MAG: hypothetical protein EOM03_15455 [Clostridia bacterium]|nr:hypothetical protein [Clostridia bacterium]
MRKRFLAALAVNLIIVAGVAMGSFAWGYDGAISANGLLAAGERLFGGVGAAMSWVIGGAIFFALLIWHNRLSRGGRHDAATGLMAVALIIASFGVGRLLQKPTDEIWALAALLLVSGVLTALMWSIFTVGTVPGWGRFQAWRRRRAQQQAAAQQAAANPASS